MKRLIQAIIIMFTDNIQWFFLSSTFPRKNLVGVERKLRLLIHSIEKGMCLPEVRLGFGKEKILELIKYINIYENMSSKNSGLLAQAKHVVNEYIVFHEKKDFDVSSYAQKYIISSNVELPGKVLKKKYECSCLEQMTYKELVSSRHSARIFADEKIEQQALHMAIDLARQTAPSACNRQSIRVYGVMENEKMQSVLRLQGGNKGFGSFAKGVLVVTADLGMYAGIEKKLPFVDGGIFVNALINSLFYYGIANCTLHSCLSGRREKKVKEMCGIQKREVVVAFIVVGKCKDEYDVPVSPRKLFEETYFEI